MNKWCNLPSNVRGFTVKRVGKQMYMVYNYVMKQGEIDRKVYKCKALVFDGFCDNGQHTRFKWVA